MKNITLQDGRKIILRPMGEADLLPAGGSRCPANCDMAIGAGQQPTEGLKALNAAMVKHYGAMAILAMDGNTVAGFISFFPTWCPHVDICDDAQIAEALTEMQEIEHPPPAADRPALHVRCVMVRKEYRGHGLGLALLEGLKDWAKHHGWKTIVGNGRIFSGRAQYQWLVAPKPPKPLWEKAGFVAAAYEPLNMPAMSSEESARDALDWYRSEYYPKHLDRDVDPDDPDWREIFAEYTMVWEQQED